MYNNSKKNVTINDGEQSTKTAVMGRRVPSSSVSFAVELVFRLVKASLTLLNILKGEKKET